MQVNILEAKTRLSELLKCAQAGEEVIIANRGQPIVQLVPIGKRDEQSLPPYSGAALVAWLRSRPYRASSRSAEEIEAAIQEARDAWD
jgi:prevent-host-death family protein